MAIKRIGNDTRDWQLRNSFIERYDGRVRETRAELEGPE
jgi:hypothetical protein